MTERRDSPPDPRAAFVVETRLKPDGRFIHYYEWPDPPPERARREPAKGLPDDPARPERGRV